MAKIRLFFKLYRGRTGENVILFLLYSLLAAAVSMVLFVQANNTVLFANQAAEAEFVIQDFTAAFQGAENILGILAIAATAVGAGGGICLIAFRNRATEKSQTLLYIMGMGVAELILKASLDVLLFAVGASGIGFLAGYLLFTNFSATILQTDVEVGLWSLQSLTVLLKMGIFIFFIIFGGNLYTDLWIMESPVSETLYERKGEKKKKKSGWILGILIVGTFLYGAGVFHVSYNILSVCLVIVLIVSGILFLLFQMIFGVFTKASRKNKKINTPSELSFCFLCSRYKRDAVLAMIISIGTILMCLASNLLFNVSGMLRNAYRDNMGFSVLVRVDDYSNKDVVKAKLDEMGIGYTYAYSKLESYALLNGNFSEEDRFYALVIEEQTDQNRHFYVPENSFLAENYFIAKCGLESGTDTDIFGESVKFIGALEDSQYLSPVNYNFIVNKEDWKFGIDDTWSPVFLIDATVREEELIQEKLQDYGCHLESAWVLIEELKELMWDYLSLILLLAAMLMIVTAACFYTVIRTDLRTRKTEMYLYRIFGASPAKTQNVIFREYIIIALIASFAVSFTIMLCGELYFYFGLKKHFPLSIPIILATTGFAMGFVFLCCRIAGRANMRDGRTEVIRDE